MPETAKERANADKSLKQAALMRRETAKRKRDEVADLREENPRLRRNNHRLEQELTTMRAQLAEGAEQRAALQAELDIFRNRPNDLEVADLHAQNARQADEITQLKSDRQLIQQNLDRAQGGREALQEMVPHLARNQRADTPHQAEQPRPQPSARDVLTPGREQYRDINANGSRPDRTRSFRTPIAVARPENIGRFVKHGGLPAENINRYVIPSGIITTPHVDLLPDNQPRDRATTPIEQRPQSVYYDDKVYYHIASSNTLEADQLGLVFERKTGSSWADVEAFTNASGLWCCNNNQIDRVSLSHLTQINVLNGDYLEAGVQPSQPHQVVMTYRDRSSRRGR